MAESDISLSGGAVLDGVTQGDGSHLVGEFLTINTTTTTEFFVTENDTDFDDNDGDQLLNGTQSFDGTTYADGTRIEAEYQFVVQDDLTASNTRWWASTSTTALPLSARSRASPSSAPCPPRWHFPPDHKRLRRSGKRQPTPV